MMNIVQGNERTMRRRLWTSGEIKVIIMTIIMTIIINTIQENEMGMKYLG